MGNCRLRLIEHIYSTPNHQEKWDAVLQSLVAITNSRSARLLVMDTKARRVFSSFKVNIDDYYHKKYVDYYVNACPWRRELPCKRPGQLYSTYMHFSCSQSDFYKSEFYNDWASPQDIHHGLCGTIYQDSKRSVQLLLQRTRGQGHYDDTDTHFVNNFIPHFQQSFLLASQINDISTHAQALSTAATRKRLPFLLLDMSLRVIYCSDAAEKIVSNETAISIGNKGDLRITDEKRNHSLQKLLLESLEAAETRAFNSLGGELDILRSKKTSIQLLVRPIHPDCQLGLGVGAGYVAVYIYDAEDLINIDGYELRKFYSLSKAETRVALTMLASSNPKEAARICCISLNTLRSHLKAIFVKTETHSQASLMKLLLTGHFRRL